MRNTWTASKLKKRVALISIMLLVGVLAGVLVIASGPEKGVPRTGKECITVVKTQPKHLTPQEREHRRAQYEARLSQLLGIAMKDDRVQKTINGKEYSVVSIALKKHDHARESPESATDTAFLILRVGSDYFKITIDMRGVNVTSIEVRSCCK